MPDVNFLQQGEGRNPWTDPDFNTCTITIPEPGLSLPYDSMKAKESESIVGETEEGGACNWTLTGYDLYNNNQMGQVLIGTKIASVYLPVSVMSKGGESGSNINLLELENIAYGTINAGTRTTLLFTQRHPDNDHATRLGRFVCGMQNEWAITTYADWTYCGGWGEIATYGNPVDFCTDGTYFYMIANSIPGLSGSGSGLIKITAYDGTIVGKTGGTGSGVSQFGLAAGSQIVLFNGLLYVADTSNHRIKIYNATDLSYVTLFGGSGSGDGKFNGPEGLYVDFTGIYVSDTGNRRLQKFDYSTKVFVSKYGSSGSGDDQFNIPERLASDGVYLWVADTTANGRIKKHLLSDFSYVSKVSSITGDTLDAVSEIVYRDGFLYIGSHFTSTFYKLNPADWSIISQMTVSLLYGTPAILEFWDQYIIINKYGSEGPGTGWVFSFFFNTINAADYAADGYFSWELSKNGITIPRMKLTYDGYLFVNKSAGSERVEISGNFKGDGQFISTLATGAEPIDVTSTTRCVNLNADMLDGYHYTSLQNKLLDGSNHTDTISRTAVLGDTIYATAAPSWDRLSGNITTTKKYLSQTGTGAISAVPSWAEIAQADISGLKTTDGPSFDHVHLTVAGGTAPLVVTSNTKVDNLNADLLDGNEASAFLTSVPAHNLLSATHGDALADNVIAGDVLIGNATPKWARLAKSTDGKVLTLVSGLPAWAAASIGALDDLTDVNAPTPGDTNVLSWNAATSKWIAAASGGSLALDDLTDVNAPAPTDGYVLSWNAGTSRWIAASPAAPGAHDILSASHGDTLAAAVARGHLIVGNSTPKWSALAIGTSGKFLKSGAADVSWEIPAWAEVSKSGSILDDLGDCVFGGAPAQGDVIYRDGSNQWVNLARGTETLGRQRYLRTGTTPSWAEIVSKDCQWIDHFADASVYFSWLQSNTTASKTITESGSVVTFAITALQSCLWDTSTFSATTMTVVPPWHGNYSFEVLLNNYTVNDDTFVGIFVTSFLGASNTVYGIGRLRDDGTGPYNGVCVWRCAAAGPGTVAASSAETTLPIYLRINVGSYIYHTTQVQFQYSTDGASWTTLYTLSTTALIASQYNHMNGITVRNWSATYSAISAPFEYARFYQDFGPG